MINKGTPKSFLSNEVFQEIFQSSAEGIIMVDREGAILLLNPAAEAMFGYSIGTLIGTSIENLLPKRFHKAHEGHRHKFNEHPSPRHMGVGRDLWGVRKDGSEFPVEVSLSFKDIKGQLIIMAFIIDITERKKDEEVIRRSEEQLLVYAAELEKKVLARTEELNKSINELSQANDKLQVQIIERKKAEEEAKNAFERERELNELKSKFVSIASHEFRTPLSTVMSSTSLIAQYKNKGELAKIDKHTQRIKLSVGHLTSILNDFLSLGKLEEGKIEVEKEKIELKDFLMEVMEEIEPTLRPKQHIELNFNGPKTINTDTKLVRNILFNLLSNASKYSEEGKKITITTQPDGKTTTFIIADEGMGIPKSQIKHLFERFFRASNVTNIQGTGLGLNILKRYVDLLQGTIDFESEEGKGSIFRVSLPL